MGTDAAFATLGLAVGAPSIDITRAFRALCRALHPDRGGDRTRFETVVSAYRCLQRHGLVPATPRTSVAPARRNPYADLRLDLERYAAMVPARPTPRAHTVQAVATPAAAAPSDRFAALLDQELARLAA